MHYRLHRPILKARILQVCVKSSQSANAKLSNFLRLSSIYNIKVRVLEKNS